MAITRLGGANAISGTLPAANINNTSIGNITSLPAAVDTGAMVLLNTTTISSGTSNVNFDNTLITSSYKSFIFKGVNVHLATDSSSLLLKFSSDNGSTITSSNYDRVLLAAAVDNSENTVSSRFDDGNRSNALITGSGTSQGNANDESCSFELFAYDLTESTFKKLLYLHSVYTHNGGKRCFNSGYTGINSSSAINYVRFEASSGNLDSGQISVYGVKT